MTKNPADVADLLAENVRLKQRIFKIVSLCSPIVVGDLYKKILDIAEGKQDFNWEEYRGKGSR